MRGKFCSQNHPPVRTLALHTGESGATWPPLHHFPQCIGRSPRGTVGFATVGHNAVRLERAASGSVEQELAASFVGLHLSTKLALVLQHRLTTKTFVCQHLQHYRRLMLSLALSCHTPSSLIICSSPCLAHHRHAGGRNHRFVESNHQKEMQSKQRSSNL